MPLPQAASHSESGSDQWRRAPRNGMSFAALTSSSRLLAAAACRRGRVPRKNRVRGHAPPALAIPFGPRRHSGGLCGRRLLSWLVIGPRFNKAARAAAVGADTRPLRSSGAAAGDVQWLQGWLRPDRAVVGHRFGRKHPRNVPCDGLLGSQRGRVPKVAPCPVLEPVDKVTDAAGHVHWWMATHSACKALFSLASLVGC